MRLITRKAAAKHWGVSPGTIDKWRKSGLLKTYRPPGMSRAVRLSFAEVRNLGPEK